MDEVVFSDIAYYGRFAIVVVISIMGTVTNGISLSFFLKHQKESLADKHLIFLNITDLLICFLSPAALFCLSKLTKLKEGCDSQLLSATIAESYVSLSLLSCFITTMLSVTRTLVLTKPLYIIRINYVHLAHCINTIFSLVFITCKIVLYHNPSKKRAVGQFNEWEHTFYVFYSILYAIQFLYVIVTVGIVGISSVIVVRALRRPPEILAQQAGRRNNETNRRATEMILTLSVIFAILNGAWCVFWAICTVIVCSVKFHGDFVRTLRLFAMFLSLFLITINSFANPVVYMLRNSRLNNHTKSLLRGVKQLLMSNTENAVVPLATCNME